MKPQKENGFTAIANEIMEEIAKLPLSNYEFRILLTIFRKTYGWNKKEDNISLSQLSEITNIPSSHCSRTLKKLHEKNIIVISNEKSGLTNCISFQKDYNKWVLLPKQVLPIEVLPKQDLTITNPNDLLLPKQVDTKDIITKDNTKEINTEDFDLSNIYKNLTKEREELLDKYAKLKNILCDEIFKYWGFSEKLQCSKKNIIKMFLCQIILINKINPFTNLFYFYKKIYSGDNLKFRCKLNKFMGTVENKFDDGEWNSENWEDKLSKELPQYTTVVKKELLKLKEESELK